MMLAGVFAASLLSGLHVFDFQTLPPGTAKKASRGVYGGRRRRRSDDDEVRQVRRAYEEIEAARAADRIAREQAHKPAATQPATVEKAVQSPQLSDVDIAQLIAELID